MRAPAELAAPAPALVARFRHDLLALTGAVPAADMRLGLAVSGGTDSVALLLLAQAAFPGAVAAATVDHGVRPEAAAEAGFVAALCATLGVPHAVLAGGGEPLPRGSMQQRARALRYAQLGAWREGAGARWLATAHQLDDQAETFLMRAARGSGVAGLAGVRAAARASVPDGLALLRPLLGWRRTTLADIVAAAGIAPVDDPSNRDPRHDRTHFRALLAREPLLAPARLGAAAANLADAEEALAWTTERLWHERSRWADDTLIVDARALPREYRRRLLTRTVAALRPHATQPTLRGEAISRLLALLDAGRAATLGGALLRPRDGGWQANAAPPRRTR